MARPRRLYEALVPCSIFWFGLQMLYPSSFLPISLHSKFLLDVLTNRIPADPSVELKQFTTVFTKPTAMYSSLHFSVLG